MTTTPNPTWYDVLGVPRDASSAEVKAAWRSSTDKFEPGSGSGQFRMFNEAADVLLDPDRRAAYDASLDAPAATATTLDDPPPPAPVAPAVTTPTGESTSSKVRRPRARKVRPAGEGAPATRRAVALTALLAVLTVAAIVAAVVLGLQVRRDAGVADARDQAPAAAERAAKAVFSYDYRTLPTDRERAKNYLSPAFAAKYLKNFDALATQKDGTAGLAVQSKAVVKASVLGSGVVDAQDGVARVLVYVNLTSTKAGGDPQIFQNRVSMTMEKSGNRWLVDGVNTY